MSILPQLLWLALHCVGLGLAMAQHGQPEKGTHNVWVGVIGTGIQLALLYWGGFFNTLLGANQ